MARVRSSVVAALVVAAVLTATGCSAQPPELPDVARQRTLDGAKAFAVHFFDTYGFALTTGSVEPLQALCTPDAMRCQAMVTDVEDMVEDGEHADRSPYVFRRVGFPSTYPVTTMPADGRVIVELEREPVTAQWVTATGTRRPLKSGDSTIFASVEWTDGGWRYAG